mmetsp:Transcript_1802/g.5690  ORF Transcript_1802/g.5690 Transcript_1802/m.5690 type:complete len:85 (-) Transcript_1802:1188-1442(-)
MIICAVEKLRTWYVRKEDVDENDRKYEGMEVMSTPVEMGRKAPAQKSQEAMRSSRAAKDGAAPLMGPESAARATKAHATRSAAA